MTGINILRATTPRQHRLAQEIRRKVFIEEQGVPELIEVDEYEGQAEHFLARLGRKPVAAGRLRLKKSYAKFERIATLKDQRGHGIGKALMEFMQEYCFRIHPNHLQAMHAQRDAVGFYEKLGWVAIGKIFYEADIPHQVMIFPPKRKADIQNLLIWNDPEARQDIKIYLTNRSKR